MAGPIIDGGDDIGDTALATPDPAPIPRARAADGSPIPDPDNPAADGPPPGTPVNPEAGDAPDNPPAPEDNDDNGLPPPNPDRPPGRPPPPPPPLGRLPSPPGIPAPPIFDEDEPGVRPMTPAGPGAIGTAGEPCALGPVSPSASGGVRGVVPAPRSGVAPVPPSLPLVDGPPWPPVWLCGVSVSPCGFLVFCGLGIPAWSKGAGAVPGPSVGRFAKRPDSAA